MSGTDGSYFGIYFLVGIRPGRQQNLSTSSRSLRLAVAADSRSAIFWTRRAWRPPSNSVFSQIARAGRRAARRGCRRRGRARSRSLWRRLISAVRSSWHGAARTPGTCWPRCTFPVRSRRSGSPLDLAGADLAGHGGGNVGIIDRPVVFVHADVNDVLPERLKSQRSSARISRRDGRCRRRYAWCSLSFGDVLVRFLKGNEHST